METAEANIPDTSTWINNTADSAQMTRKPHPYGHTHPPFDMFCYLVWESMRIMCLSLAELEAPLSILIPLGPCIM